MRRPHVALEEVRATPADRRGRGRDEGVGWSGGHAKKRRRKKFGLVRRSRFVRFSSVCVAVPPPRLSPPLRLLLSGEAEGKRGEGGEREDEEKRSGGGGGEMRRRGVEEEKRRRRRRLKSDMHHAGYCSAFTTKGLVVPWCVFFSPNKLIMLLTSLSENHVFEGFNSIYQASRQ